MKNCCCVYCKKEYSYRGIHTHVERTHLGNTNYSSGNNGKYEEIAETNRKLKENRVKKFFELLKNCLECGILLTYEQRKSKFCSHNCAAKNTNRTRDYSKFKCGPKKQNKIYSLECKFCGEVFTYSRSTKMFCSSGCMNQERINKKYNTRKKFIKVEDTNHTSYRNACKFNFSLNDYENEYDFSLIEKYGWYSPTNKNNNLEGVSRDHIISISYGWKNKIDPYYISHPANCQLLPHKDNKIKGTKCGMSLEELKIKILLWEEKYIL